MDETAIHRILNDDEHSALACGELLIGHLEQQHKTDFYADRAVVVSAPNGDHLFTLPGVGGIRASVAECRQAAIDEHAAWLAEGHIPSDTPAPDFSENDDVDAAWLAEGHIPSDTPAPDFSENDR